MFRTAFGERKRVSFETVGVSMTRQSFKKDCDINYIMAKYQKTGLIEHVNRYQGNYGDFLNVDDYQSSLIKVMQANDAFESLPSSLRKRFSNDPAEFLSFVQNPDNRDEMIELGLIDVKSVNNSTPDSENQDTSNAS